jgi:hypothetical protein
MSADTWLDDNNRYLAASLEWLRGRLHALVRDQSAPAGAAPQAAPTVRPPSLLNRLRGVSASPADSEHGQTVGTSATEPTQKLLGDGAAAVRDEAARTDPPPALVLLAHAFGLSDFERDILLLCAAVELDPDMGSLCAAAQGNAARAYPTFSLAMQAFADPSWDALSPHRPLRYLHLLEINQPGATPLTAAALRADERVVNYIKGLNALDERLSTLFSPAGADIPELAPSQQAVAERIVASLHASASGGRIPIIELLGVAPGSKRNVAINVSVALGRQLYLVTLDALPVQKAEIENLARLWQRESIMLPLALYVDAEELDGAANDLASGLQYLFSRDLGLVFVGLREPPARTIEAGVAFEIDRPTAQEQRAAWIEALKADLPTDDADGQAKLLAGQFNLNLHDIGLAAAQARHAQAPMADMVWDACCGLTRPRLDQLSQRIDPVASWDDLVLPAEALGLLHQIAAQVRGRYQVYEDWGYAKKMTRGLGISALFAGESGTGKTMAAEVLANELRLALYRIDLSSVVSKYIGETEKNLRRLFDAAEQGGAILFFDEADALFGKRSEVKDSHDRYANIEINYLLQRMESFGGLAILATNMKGALDQAFMRRLRFIVNFPFPGATERSRIWQMALAPEVPRDGIDYERLARFNLSGGNIHSIALNAAFTAAQRADGGRSVTMPMLLSATRSELRKLDKQINEADFRPVQPTRSAG